MSANIYYQPVGGKDLNIGGPSSFLNMLRRLTNSDGPWEFGNGDTEKLEGALAALTDREHGIALGEILNAVYLHDRVRVWAEY